MVWYFKGKYEADVIAYVIMPNHLHVIVYFKSDGFKSLPVENDLWLTKSSIVLKIKGT